MEPGDLIATSLAEYRRQQQTVVRSCPFNQKIPFLTRDAARKYAQQVKKKLFPYECSGCGQFHLTSRLL